MGGGALAEIDESPLPLHTERAFENLEFRRPVALTHAGDGSNRVFVADQYGLIYVFENSPDVEESQVFLDIESRVVYKDNENEEGLLGLAFHPRYRETGEFFVYYTSVEAPHTSVVSRFRVSDDPNHADPASEEEILRIKQPYWNHNGGTIVFGPDGYLYIVLGDGGSRADPQGNGQNLKTLLGSVLRIDVDRKENGLNYAIPADNPFVGTTDGARPEIWAYGLRNVWRLTFDRETGTCWAGDVGQDVWEEIDIIVKGGNYGWNLREGKHPFGPHGVGPREDLIEPIWEYHHDVGKSITGGHVYRGKELPELAGYYLYGDYVSGILWALKYDMQEKRVVENRTIRGYNLPVVSYGEDEEGEVYFTSTLGGTIWQFVRDEE